jgi:hypothetical protein
VDSAKVEWDIPESDGGSPIVKYKVERRDITKTAYISVDSVDAKTLNVKATKLAEGNKYLFRVAAENEIGESDWAETSEPIEAKHPFGKLEKLLILTRHEQYAHYHVIKLRDRIVDTLCVIDYSGFLTKLSWSSFYRSDLHVYIPKD